MVLYHAVTVYHILKFAIHKLKYHPFEDAVLLVPSFMARKKIDETMHNGIFVKVYWFSWENSRVNKYEAYLKIENELNEALGGYELKDFEEINVASGAYWIGSYLVDHDIKFNWFEEADGRFSDPYPIMEDDKRIATLRYESAVERGLYTGENPCVVAKYIKYDSQSCQIPCDKRILDFDVIKEMENLSNEDKNRLRKFFCVPDELVIKKGSSIMLTQHFCNMRQLSYKEHILIYQSTADYYMDGLHFYYKLHPSDFMPYSSFIENIDMISGDFPSELLLTICKEKFEIGAAISSTGIKNIGHLYKKELLFDFGYLKTFFQNDEYYFIRKMIENLGYVSVYAVGVNVKQMENMIVFGGEHIDCKIDYFDSISRLEKDNKKRIWTVGQVSCDEACDIYNLIGEEDVLVYLNPDNENSFRKVIYEKTFLVKNIILKTIDEKVTSEKSYKPMQIWTKDENARMRIKDMKYEKELINSGIIVEVTESDDKDMEISILKGRLRAAERELEKIMGDNFCGE